MKRRDFIARCLAGAGIIGIAGKLFGWNYFLAKFYPAQAAESIACRRLVVLGDPHLPVRTREVKSLEKQQRILAAKREVLQQINGWPDVDGVTVLGDVAAQFGNAIEYDFAKAYFSGLEKPVFFIAGNHDYIYEDGFDARGHLVKGSEESKAAKLRQFQKNFGLKSLYYSRQVNAYRLLYLSPDSLLSPHLTEMSPAQLEWVRRELAAHKKEPTIVFFHAPLQDTLLPYNHTANKPDFIAQPAERLAEIIRANKQIVLWVSGHTHTPATNESYANAAINTYAGQVQNIHTSDMDREVIWSNSLYLYADKIVVRTYNHAAQQWEEALDRTILLDKNGHMA